MNTEHKFPYNWKLSDGYPEKNGLKVFSCFSCGGGSTMGYKLAGFEVIGCNEIDPKMMEVYKANHNPKYSYLEGIQTFKNRTDLPEELFNLDILDGSPPCSSFSMAGNREKDWGKEKVFREGQSEQVLDTLFFDFIELAERLQPKIVIAENVKGMLLGEAKKYVRKIYKAFEKAGYKVQHFLLDASQMGVPQKRERVFFIALRNDLADPFLQYVDMFTNAPYLNLVFNEPFIPVSEILKNAERKVLSPSVLKLFDQRLSNEFCLGETAERLGKRSHFNYMVVNPDKPCYTITAKENTLIHEGGYLTEEELTLAGSYPQDYNFKTFSPEYLIGMSVPPVMMAQIASRVYEQWLSKIKQSQLIKAA